MTLLISGGISAVVKRFIVSEGSSITLPHNSIILKSEVVVNSETDAEVLELWLAVPTVDTPDTSHVTKAGHHTIYTNTEVYTDDEELEDWAVDLDSRVENRLMTYNAEELDEWDD